MGRGGRKKVEDPGRDGLEPGGVRHWTDTHPDRRLWSPGRLAQARTQTLEEYEALYGRGISMPRVREVLLRSPFFPGISAMPADYEAAHRPRIIARMDVRETAPLRTIQDDPVLAALWQEECKRIEREREWFEKIAPGERHWSEEALDPEDVWRDEIIPGWFWDQGEGNVIGWSFSQDNLRRFLEIPSSYLAATIERQPRAAAILARNIASICKAGQGPEYFQKTLLPEIRYLTNPEYPSRLRHVLGPALAKEIWELAFLMAGNAHNDIRAHNSYLQEIIEKGGGNLDAFRAVPLTPSTSSWHNRYAERAEQRYKVRIRPTPEMEALHGMHWSAFERGSAEEEMDHVAKNVFADQIIRVYYGLDADPDSLGKLGWKEYRRGKLFRRPPSPLENLRPIFRGEDREALLDDLVQYYQKEEGTPPIAALLRHNFDLKRALQTSVSEEIFEALGPGAFSP